MNHGFRATRRQPACYLEGKGEGEKVLDLLGGNSREQCMYVCMYVCMC